MVIITSAADTTPLQGESLLEYYGRCIHRYRIVFVDDDIDFIAMPCQGFNADGVVHNPNTIWQAQPSSVSPIYIPGRFTHSIQPFNTLLPDES